ncbi:thioredoxin [Fictibacillus macauensis ZFHKF-1]|uniref:Thioredoxin n=1 Tax=Fictibacillus macauensis ZFHKF-1 TaxID=1196324 RepID=I8UJZ4_9BACL|nr:thioredoxin family protein [Fictibacillus macauensis]EIT87148.1 thioredoxin [Fictibacillus macauensis ZFHKF-1]
MKHIAREEIGQLIQQSNEETVALYIQTPLCGTCKVGKRMVDLALTVYEAEHPSPQLGACNLNEVPELAETYSITSVPCLLFIKRGIAVKQMYAMKSVDYLYENMKNYF